MDRVHTQQGCRRYQAGSSGRCTRRLCHHSEGTWMGWRNGPKEASWRPTKSNARCSPWGDTAPCCSTSWGWSAQKQHCRKGPEVSGEHIEDESATASGCKDRQHSGLHQEEHHQPVKGGHPFPISQIPRNHVEVKNSPLLIFSPFFILWRIFVPLCDENQCCIRCKMCTANYNIIFKQQLLFLDLFD